MEDFTIVLVKGRAKADVSIYISGAYISKHARERFQLVGKPLNWYEDKESQRIALKTDAEGIMIHLGRSLNLSCPRRICLKYKGRYNLMEEEGVLVLHPVESVGIGAWNPVHKRC